MKDLDPKALEAAREAYDDEFGQLEDGIRAYLCAVSPSSEMVLDRIAECIWQAEWKRAGNGGPRRVPWSEVAPDDQ